MRLRFIEMTYANRLIHLQQSSPFLYKDAMEANSPVVRENCWEWYTSVVKTRMHNFSGELIVFTRWHEEDLIGTLCRREPFVEFTDWAQLDTLPPDTWLYLNFEALKTRPPSPVDPREPGEACLLYTSPSPRD